MIDICCVISFLVHGQTDRQTQTEKHTERERDKQTDRQTKWRDKETVVISSDGQTDSYLDKIQLLQLLQLDKKNEKKIEQNYKKSNKIAEKSSRKNGEKKRMVCGVLFLVDYSWQKQKR